MSLKGTIVKSTGSWYEVKTAEGEIIPCRIVGKFRLHGKKLTNPVAVGDEVVVEREGENGLIVEILDRKNYVIRQSPRKKHYLHILASNIDQAILIVTIVEPKLKPGFIDRFLLMTEPYNIPVTIVFNKSDLYGEDELLTFQYYSAVYESIGYNTMLASSINLEGVEQLKTVLKDKTSLIAGQSGVGKSTLINCMEEDLDLRTTELSDFTGKGQHTTTFAEMFELSSGGRIIDSPGIKMLGMPLKNN